MKKVILSTFCLLSSLVCFAQYAVLSPDMQTGLFINTTTDGRLVGKMTFRKKQILTTEMVSFEFINSPELKNNLQVKNYVKKHVDNLWRPVLKRHEKVSDNYNEVTINLTEKVYPKRKLQLIARVYNDGIAYRTKFIDVGSGVAFNIKEENTSFDFGAEHTCWVADHEKFVSPQESFFYSKKLSEITTKTLIGLPLTVKVSDSCYAAITEADLTDYAGMYLHKDNDLDKFKLRCVLAPTADSGQAVKVAKSSGLVTPWRVVMLGRTAGSLIESEIVNNLNPPCAISDPSWIKPGISAWDNWFSYGVKMDQVTIKKFIDLASEMTWPYMIVDWQWYGPYNKPEADITRSASTIELPELIRYAKDRNVKLILWLYWTDVDRSDWEKVCALYESWGIAGVKIDFMNRDDQAMVNWYERIVKTAASHKLMVDFHGAYKPTGLGRTYPNQVTREGVMGNEWNKWSTMITPEHLCTLPFTRMLAGPMDFTPGCFENRTAETFRVGEPTNTMVTRCNSLAQFVVFDSPLTVACDHPDNYRNQTGTEFLKKLKTIWDDTRVLSGAIGDHIVMARRDGYNWFIGAMNNSYPKNKKIHLNFLGSGSYKMTSYSDDILPNKAVVKSKLVKSRDIITINMAPGGGFAAYFEPAN